MNHIPAAESTTIISYGCSTRADGTMLVAVDGELYPLGQQNREKFFQTNNIEHWAVCHLAHGTNIRAVSMPDDKTVAYDFDGLITSSPNLFLCLTVADCFLVYFWSKDKNFVGIAHAGWRGVSDNIVSKMVEKIKSDFAYPPEYLIAAIGPGIRQCHFEVKEDVLNKFSNFPEQITTRDGRIYINLAGIIKRQLITAGVSNHNITDTEECTYCLPDKYFSYRRNNKEPIEVMLAYVGMTP